MRARCLLLQAPASAGLQSLIGVRVGAVLELSERCARNRVYGQTMRADELIEALQAVPPDSEVLLHVPLLSASSDRADHDAYQVPCVNVWTGETTLTGHDPQPRVLLAAHPVNPIRP